MVTQFLLIEVLQNTDDNALHGAKLVIPSFTKGKTQLSQKEVETSKQLSQVRIHVERI